MCTSIVMRDGAVCFGRNMDIDSHFDEKLVILPRKYPADFGGEKRIESHYAIMGIAAVFQGYPLFADAINEKGLYMAGLSFPDNAAYGEMRDGAKYNIAPYDFIFWVLCQCETTSQVKALLKKTKLISKDFSRELKSAPLHWHIADEHNSLCIESVAEGIKIYDNPFDVLTNNPCFPHHVTQMWKTESLSNKNPPLKSRELSGGAQLGLGSLGLRGDFSSHSRFEKAAFLLRFCSGEKENRVSHFFNILSSVSVVKGAVLTEDGKPHSTLYTVCYEKNSLKCHFKGQNGGISSHAMEETFLNGNTPAISEPYRSSDFTLHKTEG